jgi:histidyl-tRNA synthetase
MDYYCHTVFEFKSASLGAQDTVLGGGRYDGLMEQMGGPFVPAVGFACGIERLSLVAENLITKKNSPILSLLPLSETEEKAALIMLQKLRKHDIASEMLTAGKLAKRLTAVSKREIPYVVVVGADEIQSNIFTLKKMHGLSGEEKKEEKLTVTEIIEKLSFEMNKIT